MSDCTAGIPDASESATGVGSSKGKISERRPGATASARTFAATAPALGAEVSIVTDAAVAFGSKEATSEFVADVAFPATLLATIISSAGVTAGTPGCDKRADA